MRIVRLQILVWILFLTFASAQDRQAIDSYLQEAASHISTISPKLKFASNSDYQRYEREKKDLTNEFNTTIDAVLADSSFDGLAKATSIVNQLLGMHQGSSEHNGPVFVQGNDLLYGRSVIIGYGLERGGPAVNDSAVTIRGYRETNGKMALSDTIGSDFDSYGLFIRPLVSPISGESWFIAWGPKSGFNGRMDRVRVYSFDGKRFRTIWSPDDMLNVTINVTSFGFSIQRIDADRYYLDWRCPCLIQEDYVLMVQGPVNIGKHHVD